MRNHDAFRSLAACLTAVAISAASTRAQCQNISITDGPAAYSPGIDGTIAAQLMWDPDGAGPATAQLIVAGNFTEIAGTGHGRIAAFDPATETWSPLGTGMDWTVDVVAELPNGDLLATGPFSSAGGVPANGIARWDGSSWSAFTSGIGGNFARVRAATVLPGGELVLAGSFQFVDGVPADNIALWNGSTWSALGSGTDSWITSLAVDPAGDLLVAGDFTTAGGQPIANLARWNASGWSAVGTGSANGRVHDLAILPNGDLVAGGEMSNAWGTGSDHIARFDGVSWQPMSTGTDDDVTGLLVLPGGDLFVSGSFFSAGGVTCNRLARWNGSWSPVGAGLPGAGSNMVALPNGDVSLGGRFARWDGSRYTILGRGFDGWIQSFEIAPDGSLIAIGQFDAAGDVPADSIARWNGVEWSQMGAGMALNDDYAYCVHSTASGEVLIGGTFHMPTPSGPAENIARWNGSEWLPMPGGLDLAVNDLVSMPNGDVIAVGIISQAGGQPMNNVARWDGSQWSSVGTGIPGWPGRACVTSNGELVVSGSFTMAGGVAANRVARWDGSAWSAMGAGINGVTPVLVPGPGGTVLAVEFGGSDSVVIRWDGTAWQPVTTAVQGLIGQLQILPDGDLLAIGYLTSAGSTTLEHAARWNGTAWVPFGSGNETGLEAMIRLANGDIVLGGSFATFNGVASPGIAQLSTTCPALVQPYGNGCTGSGGANVLAADALPWVGSTYRATATGLPSSAIALSVFGFGAASLPLSAILMAGGPGCELLATADYVELLTPTAGELATDLRLPNDPSLAGTQLHHQVAPLVLDAQLAVLEFTSSNALRLTVGSF